MNVFKGTLVELTNQISGSGKLYLPGQITDLAVIMSDPRSGQVTLQWTSVGDQLDHGQGTIKDAT